MIYHTPRRFRKNLLALAACAAVAPHCVWAVDFAQGPPGTKEPYVAPNVILSLDDSGSMGSATSKGTKAYTLKEALKDVFNDTNLLPNGKIRFAWQTMNDRTSFANMTTLGDAAASASTVSTTANVNLMRSLDDAHRANFLAYMDAFTIKNDGTPTHRMVQRADQYMRAGLNKNGPWASKPGQNNPEYLGCRRNYHILLTDGGWNGTVLSTKPVDNYDGAFPAPNKLPDGTVYANNAANNRLYRDSENVTTIADWAFKSWADQLQDPDRLTGTVQPTVDYRTAPATEVFKNRATGSTATLGRFWNPRYNPATWPHMVTFTIGFGSDALPSVNYLASGKTVAMTKPTSMLPYGFDGNLADYANGTYSWKAWGGQTSGPPKVDTADRGHDMWHAALNGRGAFYAVEKNEDLKAAFEKIIGTINTETEPESTSTAASGSNASRYDVGTYTARYEPEKAWKGYLSSETVDKSGAAVVAWGGKNTADLLDAAGEANRLVLGWSDLVSTAGGSVSEKGGVPFKWRSDQAYLSNAQKTKLGTSAATPVVDSAQRVLEYIRGARTYEAPPSGASASNPFRQRQSMQGDIINSGVWYTGAPANAYSLPGYSSFVRAQKARTPMVYVGGNDGMLHGFSAIDGTEKIAYVPQGVLATLKYLASPGYDHRYFVDGSPMTGDVELGGVVNGAGGSYYQPDWRTMLVGTLGAGGRGYFVLDVTNPDGGGSSQAPAFTEAGAATLVKLDRTRGGAADARDCAGVTAGSAERVYCDKAAAEEKDLGHITAQPVRDDNDPMRSTQITRMNNNRWAVVMGNGYNSANQRPVLLIQYLDGMRELLRIPASSEAPGTGQANDNGLSAPRLVDLNGDGRVDIAYAGDNLGNMWKFDLTSGAPAVNAQGVVTGGWGVAFGGAPLFTASGPASLGSATRTIVQHISVAPTVRANDRKSEVTLASGGKTTVSVGGMMVAFGTGRIVSKLDPNSVAVQTLYSVLDNTRYRIRSSSTATQQLLEVHPGASCAGGAVGCQNVPAPAPVVQSGLVKRSIKDVTGDVQGTPVVPEPGQIIENEDLYARDTKGDLTRNWLTGKSGWFMDLPAIGERLLKNMEMYDNSNLLMAYTQVPAKGSNVDITRESCESTAVDRERQYRTFINIMDGAKPSIQLIDVIGDNSYDAVKNAYASRERVDAGSHSKVASSDTEMLDLTTCKGKNCLRQKAEVILRMPEQTLRPTWRQMK